MHADAQSRELTSADSVLDALGGVSGVCELTGAKPKTISAWKQSNSFPSRFFLLMTGELDRRGYHAPASLWDMRLEPEAR